MAGDRERRQEGGVLMRAGFLIEDRFYPVPEAFRLADPVLVEELTGLSWGEFEERLPSGEEDADGQGADPVALLGLVGVAVWQQNPRWRRDRVLRYVQQIPQSALGIQAPDDEGVNGGPPAVTAGVTQSSPSASSSESVSAVTSPTSSPPSSGTPTSPTSPEEPSA